MTERPGLDTGASPPPAVVPVSPGARPVILPSEVDPTVFDEAFLRQLERLLLLMRSPARGGLKGGRRSVKRGQSVEFADYRDYTPEKLLFAKRAAAALGYIGLASEDRVAVSVLAGRMARRRSAMRGSGRVFRLLADLSSVQVSDGPTDLVAAARHAAAQLSGRGVLILLSDLLDPAADKVIRELAATGSELVILHILSPDELDPPLEGDLRLVDTETGERVDITADLATIDAYKARLTEWKAGFADLAAKRRASYVDLPSDVNLAELMFAELRRRRVLG
jgi:uncharacterized protein (DUF58 family)